MKVKKIVFIVSVILLFVLGIFACAQGQTIPKGVYVAQPRGNGSSIVVVWPDYSEWPKEYVFQARFNPGGDVFEMTFSGGSADMGTAFKYVFQADFNKIPFNDIKKWKEFAEKVRNEFVTLKYGYAEKTPFGYFGLSISLDNGENPDGLQSLIFHKEGRLLSIPRTSWIGAIPKKGDAVLIGQTSRSEFFFPVKKEGGKYTFATEVDEVVMGKVNN